MTHPGTHASVPHPAVRAPNHTQKRGSVCPGQWAAAGQRPELNLPVPGPEGKQHRDFKRHRLYSSNGVGFERCPGVHNLRQVVNSVVRDSGFRSCRTVAERRLPLPGPAGRPRKRTDAKWGGVEASAWLAAKVVSATVM